MKYNYEEDEHLTDAQKTLKWSLYCESEHESDENIRIVLRSLLKDLED